MSLKLVVAEEEVCCNTAPTHRRSAGNRLARNVSKLRLQSRGDRNRKDLGKCLGEPAHVSKVAPRLGYLRLTSVQTFRCSNFDSASPPMTAFAILPIPD